ncbi:hypothetical protein [Scytonema sp. NUACC21]
MNRRWVRMDADKNTPHLREGCDRNKLMMPFYAGSWHQKNEENTT